MRSRVRLAVKRCFPFSRHHWMFSVFVMLRARQTDRIRNSLKITFALLVFVSAAGSRTDAGDASIRKYFDGLRARRLFSLAEGYCLKKLSLQDLPNELREDYTLQLSKTYSAHAKFVSATERDELWKRATRVVEQLLKENADGTRRLMFEVQLELTSASQGEFLRWQTELLPFDHKLAERARTILDGVLPRLTQLEERLTEAAANSRRTRDESSRGLTPFELRSLLNNVTFRIGVAALDRAALYPAASPDRAESLLQAESHFSRLAGGAQQEELTWKSQIHLAKTTRLQGNLKRSARLLAEIEQKKPPTDIGEQVVAEKARLLLDTGLPADAATLLLKYKRPDAPVSGELRFLNARALLALHSVALDKKQPALADELFEKIKAHVKRAELEVGGFWAYRCRMLIDESVEIQKYGKDLAESIRRAKSLFAAGRNDEAADSYGVAATHAQQSGQADLAVELGFTRASILLKQKEFNQAAADFHAIVLKFPTSKRAADSSLLWAYCLGIQYGKSRTKARREAYTTALQQHRTRFAEHPTVDEATWMLAQLEESRLQVTKALALYESITSSKNRGPRAQAAVARCHERILARLVELKQPTTEWRRQAIVRLNTFAETFPQGAVPLTMLQSEVAVRLARILLNQSMPDYATADVLLERVFASRAVLDASTKKQPQKQNEDVRWILRVATQLRVVSLAGQKRVNQAHVFLQNLSASRPEEILSVLDGLLQVAESIDADARQALGELQLKAANALNQRRAELTRQQKRRLDECRAQALVATKQNRTAAKLYETLLESTPNDKRLLTTTAELMTEIGTLEYSQQAKTHWRKLEYLETAGSSSWLNARYHVAYCCLKLKQYKECHKLLGVTKLLYPGLGGKLLRSRFLTLEEDVKKATKR